MTLNRTRPATVGELPGWAAENYADAVAIRHSSGELSYAQLAAEVDEVAAGLVALGVEAGDRVALLCETRPEWTVCDLAIARIGAVCVPIYPTNSADECAWVLGDSGARVLVLESVEHLAKIDQVRAALPALEYVIGIDTGDQAGALALPDLRRSGLTVDLSTVDRTAAESDTNTIVYTSGTTGPPKGCMLTHGNWRASLDAIEPCTTLGPGDVMYVYLPLAHLFSRMVQLVTFECGATLHYFGGDIRQVVAELATVRPTHLPSVPRLFEKVYSVVTARVDGMDAGERERFDAAVTLGIDVRRRQERGEPVSEAELQSFAEADERLFSLVRAAFGGRIQQALTGAAPIAPEILEFFYACGVPIYEAYGMTESTAVISANVPGAVKFGTVGRPLPGIEVRIAEDGEVLARSAGVFAGYHHNQAGTDEMLADGWLHTGDLGELDGDGYLRISGRKKDIIICASGKNLTPANLENDLRQSRWIAHAVMVGDRRPYPVGLIVLDAEEIVPWARERGLPDGLAELSAHPEVRALIEQVVDAANSRYAPPERIRRFAILDRDFSTESGELTPTMKIRREIVAERYADVVDALYA
jgi:long-chain acyl-CoA synthetase